MSARRRCAWGFLLLGWPAAVVIPNVWDVDGLWGHVICSTGAIATAAAGAFLFGSSKAAPRVRDWLHKRELAALRRQVAEVKAIAEHNRAQVSALNKGLALSHEAAGRPLPPEITASAPTQPQLRIVG